MLGERIRKLRKQKKLTLEGLAGKKLTKGMLSLIENNKAQPSMESLTYIAEQLEVDIAELVGGANTEHVQDMLDQAEKLFSSEDKEVKYKKLLDLISVEDLSQGYEAARLLELYSYAMYWEKKEGWQPYLDQAAKLFDELNISSNRASIGIFRATTKFVEHDYQGALDIFVKEREELEAKHLHLEPLTKLELDYHEAGLLFAVGKEENATEVMERAIQFSREKRIFYLVDDLYRLAAAYSMVAENHEKREYYLKKLRQYGEFADHASSILFYHLLNIMTLISEKKEYEKALQVADNSLAAIPVLYEPYFVLERGKALFYLGRYEEALEAFEKVVPPDIHHPIDLSFFYVIDCYKALIKYEFGETLEAVRLAENSVENFKSIPPSLYKKFSMDVLEIVKKE
ncbi:MULTISPECIES: helix-turn-helix domain-containing protein [Bacillus]|uniref:helix-turn-helix domain-containing protein n=1 Tax=Bacillus TaxID=1386 RepID=UPI000BB7F21F|nr:MULTISPECIES: helix-turn-helix transcriptional regulator [Bacillus]